MTASEYDAFWIHPSSLTNRFVPLLVLKNATDKLQRHTGQTDGHWTDRSANGQSNESV